MSYGNVKVIPPRRRPALKARVRRKPTPILRTVEHRVLGSVTLHFIRQLGDGSYAAAVDCGGVERTIRLEPQYWVTPVKEILRATHHLPPSPAPKAEPELVETGEDAK